MSTACDPQGLCPRCGYVNGQGVLRCVRCRSALVVPMGCSGACSKCLIGLPVKAKKPTSRKPD